MILTHWDRLKYICASKITIIGSDNGLCQAIILTNDVILLSGPFGTNFSDILLEIYIFSFKKCIWKCCQEIGGHVVSASICSVERWPVGKVFLSVAGRVCANDSESHFVFHINKCVDVTNLCCHECWVLHHIMSVLKILRLNHKRNSYE